jgi:PAS domain S-box-containing protein
MSASGLQRPLWPLVAIGVSYFAAHEIGFLFPDSMKLLSAVWPAGGIGLAALLLNPGPRWKAILLTMFLSGVAADLLDGRTVVASVGFMTANVMESAACAWLITRWCGAEITFHRAREMTALFTSATLVNAVTALVGAATAYFTANAGFWVVYQTWWVADGLGICLVAPLIVTWIRSDRNYRERPAGWFLEMSAVMAATLFYAWEYFSPHPGGMPFEPRSYMMMVPLAWAALRLGPRAVTTVVTALAVWVLAVCVTGHVRPDFTGSGLTEHLASVQLFIGVDCGIALLLAAGIAQHKDSEESLRESELRYRQLVEHATMGITVSVNERICFANPEAARITGAAGPADLVGRETSDIVPAERMGEVRARRKFMRETGLPASVVEVKIRRLDGKLIDIETRGLAIQYDGQPAIQSMFTDVSDRKRASEALQRSESQLRALTSRLQSLREEERTWVAREIHDHLGQLLTALGLDLRLIERRLGTVADPETRAGLLAKISSARGLADETIAAVQKMASELRPAVLDRLGLEAAIETEANAFAGRTGLVMNLSLPADSGETPAAQATALFRIFQEVLTNVARHAHATSVSVRLQRSATEMVLTVRDDGVGIRDAQLQDATSLGLLGMRERAHILGGRLSITRNPDKGTAVEAAVPLAEGAGAGS